MYGHVYWRGRSRGQGLIEYALIIAFVAFMVIGTLVLLAPQIAADSQNIKIGL
jgi:Flp pilus assembly pilin Flp